MCLSHRDFGAEKYGNMMESALNANVLTKYVI